MLLVQKYLLFDEYIIWKFFDSFFDNALFITALEDYII